MAGERPLVGRGTDRGVAPGLPSPPRWLLVDLAFLVALALVLIALLLAEVVVPSPRVRIVAGEEPSAVGLRAFDSPERDASGVFRVGRPSSGVIIPIDAPGDYAIALTLREIPGADAPRKVRVSIDGSAPTTIQLDRAPRDYQLRYRVTPAAWLGSTNRALRIYFDTEAITTPDHPEPAGAGLVGVTLERVPEAQPWRVLPLGRAMLLLLAFYAALRGAGLRARPVAAVLGVLLLAYAAWVAAARPAALAFAYGAQTQPLQFLSLLFGTAVFFPAAGLLVRGGPAAAAATDSPRGATGRAAALPAALAVAWPALLATAIGTATIFYRLGARGFWGDEVWVADWSQQQGLARTFVRFIDQPWHMPLDYTLTRVATYFGQGEWWVRLPSALLGLAAIPLIYVAGRRLFDRATGIVAALTLAVAPYHIWYAQEARPYAGLSCFGLLSFFCFLRLLDRPTRWAWLGFSAATILGIYNHLNSVLLLLPELAIGAAWVAAAWLRGRRAPGDPAWRARLTRTVAALASSLACVLLAVTPLEPGLFAYLRIGAPGAFVSTPIQVRGNFLLDLLGILGAGIGWPIVVLTALALAGAVVWFRRRPWVVALALAWFIVPLAAVAAAQPRQFAFPRYFFFMQPVYLLLVAGGVVALARALAALAGRALPAGQKPLVARVLAGAALAALLAAMFAPITWEGYRVEKTNDWSAVCRYLRARVAPGDEVTGSGYTQGILQWCFEGQPDVLVSPPRDLTSDEWRAIAHPVWYVDVNTVQSGAERDGVLAAIPRNDWAPPGLLVQTGRSRWFGPSGIAPPGTSAPRWFVLPHYEPPANLYLYRPAAR